MRRLFLALLLALPPALALAEDIDDATRKAVFALATKGYADPGAAQMRNVHKSLAKNGKGYCGEVTIPGGTEFTAFHALLGEGTDASIIRLSDYPPNDTDTYAETVRRLLVNFGCIKPEN